MTFLCWSDDFMSVRAAFGEFVRISALEFNP
jgi:hypothetical protein